MTGPRPAEPADALRSDRGVDPAELLDGEEDGPTPWHFKLLLAATVLYLVYRFIWFVATLAGHGWNG